MTDPAFDTIILASASNIRRKLLERSGVRIEVVPARVDEQAIKSSLAAARLGPRDIADALAEAKAGKVSASHPGRLVIGSDQVLEFKKGILSKPESPDEAVEQIMCLSGNRHVLHSAAVIVDDGQPVWRHIGSATLSMHSLSRPFVESYVTRNWDSIQHSVGGYKIEEEGARLFSRIDGSHFAVLGLPLLEILSYLSLKGVIES